MSDAWWQCARHWFPPRGPATAGANTRMLPPSRSHQQLLAATGVALTWCRQSHGSTQPEPGAAALLGKQQLPTPIESGCLKPSSCQAVCCALWAKILGAGNNWLADTIWPLHGSPAHSSSAAPVTRAGKVRGSSGKFYWLKTGLLLPVYEHISVTTLGISWPTPLPGPALLQLQRFWAEAPTWQQKEASQAILSFMQQHFWSF